MSSHPSGKHPSGRFFLRGRETSHLPEYRRKALRNVSEQEDRARRELDGMIARFVKNYRAYQELKHKGASVYRPSRTETEKEFEREEERMQSLRKHLDNLAKRKKKYEMEH